MLFIFLFSSISYTQEGLRKDQKFFESKIPEFENWLKVTQLNKHLKVGDLYVGQDTLIVTLESNYDCNKTTFLWKEIRKKYYVVHQRRFEQKLMDVLSFQMEVNPEEIRIKIICKDEEKFKVQIHYENNRLKVEEFILESMGNGTIKIPVDEVKNIYHVPKDTLANISIEKVRKGLSKFLLSYYESKGTAFLYKAQVDTSRTYYNELVYEISHLNNEVLDEGFYELLRIGIRIAQDGKKVEIDYTFQGKYGSGVFFVPRRSDYKDMEVYYPLALFDYERMLVKKIEEHLRDYRE